MVRSLSPFFFTGRGWGEGRHCAEISICIDQFQGIADLGNESGAPMTTPMLQTFLFSLLAFTVLYFCFLFNRLRLSRLEERVEQLKAETMAA